jgi:hypothetical protein
LGRTGSFNKDLTPHTIIRKVKLVGVSGQRTSKQYKSVTLHPVSPDSETASTNSKNVKPQK